MNHDKSTATRKMGVKQPMCKICTCKLKSIFGCDFVNLHYLSVHNCLEYCLGVIKMPRRHMPTGEAERALGHFKTHGFPSLKNSK